VDTNNLSVTLWHRDAQEFGDPIFHPNSKGVALNASQKQRIRVEAGNCSRAAAVAESLNTEPQ
jgi:hypothetical protein